MRKAVGIFRIVLIVDERVRPAVISVQTAAVEPGPQRSGAVDIQREDVIVAQAAAVVWIMLVDLEIVSVVSVQPAHLRAEPHKSLPVLDNGLDMRVRQRSE